MSKRTWTSKRDGFGFGKRQKKGFFESLRAKSGSVSGSVLESISESISGSVLESASVHCSESEVTVESTEILRPEEENFRPDAADLIIDEEDTWITQQVDRLVIAAIFSRVLKSPPPEEWKGRDGTFAQIGRILPESSINTIKKIISEVWERELRGKKYCGDRKARHFLGAYLIPDKSLYQRMVCDWIERGLGIGHTSKLLNKELIKDGLESVGRTCVRECYLRLKPEVIPIRKVAQGTNDAYSPWCRASFNICKQLAIRFDVLDPNVTDDPAMPAPIPGSKWAPPPAAAAAVNPTTTGDGVACEAIAEVANPAAGVNIVPPTATVAAVPTHLPPATTGDGIACETITEVVNPDAVGNSIDIFPTGDVIACETITEVVNPVAGVNIAAPTATVAAVPTHPPPVTTAVSDMFDINKLNKLDRYQVGWWDESHRKCSLVTISGANGCQYITRVKRDEYGNPSLAGDKSEDSPVNVNVKYEKEARFALGVALVKKLDGKVEGKRIPLFDYTEKNIISNEDWKKACAASILMVKGGDGKSGWKGETRDEYQIYENDTLWQQGCGAFLKGLGKQTMVRLNAAGIIAMSDLKNCCFNDEHSENVVKETQGVSKNKMAQWKVQFERTHLGQGSVKTFDHRTAANPFKARYGDDWETYISKTEACRNKVSINKLIDHMFEETRKIFKGTTHENDWYIYHDALTLFSSATSLQYMEEKGHKSHLILPELGCNDGTIYANRMVGMRPEVMPMDAHLNQDTHESVDRHCNVTSHLLDTDPRKFSKRTPNKLRSAYKRVWDPSLGPEGGAPSSKRIKEDIERVIDETYLKIFNRRGRVLDTSAYKGRRAEVHEERVAAPHGGIRVKGTGRSKYYWLHSQVEDCENELVREVREAYCLNQD